MQPRLPTRRSPDHFAGCLLGGAVGDALGAPVEFFHIDVIRARYGPEGITDYDVAYGKRGAITDDTQMTLFTAEGVLRANPRGHHKGTCHPPASFITPISGGCTHRENGADLSSLATRWTGG
jgi:hypothetical protein